MLQIVDMILGSDTLLYFLICLCCLMLCLFGYSTRKIWVIIFCFIFSVILLLFNPINIIFGSDFNIYIAVTIVATICTISINVQYHLGIFLLNFDLAIATTFLLFINLNHGINNVPWIVFLIALIIGICTAILSIIQIKLTTIFTTSISGGMAVGYLISIILKLEYLPIGICIGVILSIVGYFVQYKENNGLSDETPSNQSVQE